MFHAACAIIAIIGLVLIIRVIISMANNEQLCSEEYIV